MTSSVASQTETAIPAPVVSFLTRLAVALQKMRAYPPGHPMLHEAVRAAHDELVVLLAERDVLRVAIGRRELVIDGRTGDPGQLVLRDLAARLHRQRVGALVFRAPVRLEELAAGLQHIIGDPTRPEEGPGPRYSSWGVELHPVTFQALGLARSSGAPEGPSPPDAAERLWRELARLALAGRTDPGDSLEPGGGDPVVGLLIGPEALAQALAERLRAGDAPPEGLVEAIERLGRLGGGEAAPADLAEVRLRDLLDTLPPDALASLLSIRFDSPDGLERLAQVVEWLPPMALLDLVEAAAQARKQEISNFLLRLLRKLAGQGGGPAPPRPEGPDFRRVMRQIVEGWSLESPNPPDHTRVLELLAVRDQGAGTERVGSEGLRLVQMALEAGVFGDQVAEGVELALEAGDLALVIRLLAQPEGDPEAADAVWAILTRRDLLERVMYASHPDLASAAALIERVEPARVEELLDLAAAATDGMVRHLLLERIVGFGAEAGLAIGRRLVAAPVATQRLLLAALADCGTVPEGLELRELTTSGEALVRLEALRILLRDPARRADAIHQGLADDDDRVVRLVVDAAAREELPRHSQGRLLRLLANPRRNPDLRARAVVLLAGVDDPGARDWLYDGMLGRRGWLRRTRLASKSPLVLAKLRMIVTRWPEAPETRRLVRLATRDGDPELAAAVYTGEPG